MIKRGIWKCPGGLDIFESETQVFNNYRGFWKIIAQSTWENIRYLELEVN